MNNTNKCTRMSNDKYDMISSLPDEMIQHILSFLGIRQAVQTGVLSKRWVNVWTSLSNLNFDPHEFVLEDEYRLSTEERKRALDAKFKNFVETLLSRHKTSFLDTFRIKILDQDGCSDLVGTCVSYAMKVNPRDFFVEAPFFHRDISGPIFSCESIEELFLRKTYDYPQLIPEVINLPRIRRLQLTQTRLDNRCITRLFSGCPVLEDVSLEYCSGEFSCIFNQKLNYLSLRHCIFVHNYRLLCVDCCLLGYAVNSVIIGRPFHVEFMWKSVGTTEVSNTFSFMRNIFCYFGFDDNIGGLSDVIALELHIKEMKHILEAAVPKLGEFHNLKDFSVGSWCMICNFGPSFGEFHNLKDFSVGSWCMICNFGPIALFFQRTPNLQKITLYIGASRHCHGKKLVSIHFMVKYLMWTELSRCKNLKRVDIKLLKDFIIAHQIDEALLPSRKQIENTEISISEHI